MSSTELWVVVSTLIFFVLVWKPLGRALSGGLDSHRLRIVGELEEAKHLREEAEHYLAEAKQRHQSAAANAAEIVAFARDEAHRMRSEAEEEMKRHIARRERQATDRIAQAEAAAIAEVKSRAVDLALAASRQLLMEKLSESAGDRLIDEVTASLPARLSARG